MAPFLAVSTLLVFGILHLNSGGISQHDIGQRNRGPGRENGTCKTVGHELWHEADVVKVRMRQQQRIDLNGRHRARIPISRLEITFLHQATVDHDFGSRCFQAIPRPGYVAVGTEKYKSQISLPWYRGSFFRELSFRSANTGCLVVERQRAPSSEPMEFRGLADARPPATPVMQISICD